MLHGLTSILKTVAHVLMMHDIQYDLRFAQLSRHIVEVCLHIAKPDLRGQNLWLPNWIPGSYMIRDFARHVVHIEAKVDGLPWYVEKIGKNRWRCAPTLGPLQVIYQVYAQDTSVRGAHVDTTHAYFNGAAIFLAVEGQEHMPQGLTLTRPEQEWAGVQVATAMPAVDVDAQGFGDYEFRDYADLIDYPCEIAEQQIYKFTAEGVPHRVAVRGAHEWDDQRLLADLSRLCACQIRFFESKAPFPAYLFLLNVVDQGYGGLEHAQSSSLVIERAALPQPWEPQEPGDAYTQLLGLFSHEYFHAWNVKRIRPKDFVPLDLEREVHTTLLWFFEGVTSYYDDLFLLRAGLISIEHYLRLLGQQITRYWRQPGSARQSLADASFDAWTKYYRPDENSINVQTSYYVHGSLLALCLDLYMRQQIKRNRSSLDALMLALWQDYLRGEEAITYEDLLNRLRALTHREIAGFIEPLLFGRESLPLQRLLLEQGVDLGRRVREQRQDIGGTKPANGQAPQVTFGGQWQLREGLIQLTQVLYGGPLEQAGANVGDQLVAVDGRRASDAMLDLLVRRCQPGQNVSLHILQQDRLRTLTCCLQPAAEDTAYLQVRDGRRPEQMIRQWLLGEKLLMDEGV